MLQRIRTTGRDGRATYHGHPAHVRLRRRTDGMPLALQKLQLTKSVLSNRRARIYRRCPWHIHASPRRPAVTRKRHTNITARSDEVCLYVYAEYLRSRSRGRSAWCNIDRPRGIAPVLMALLDRGCQEGVRIRGTGTVRARGNRDPHAGRDLIVVHFGLLLAARLERHRSC